MKGLEREAAEARVRKEREEAMKRDLDSMTTLRSRMRSDHRSYEQAADADALARWSAEKAAVEEREARKRELERAEFARIRAMNEVNAEERARMARQEFDEDVARLQAALNKEAEQERIEREAAGRRRAEAQAHRRALVEQMAIQAEETSYLDDMQREVRARGFAVRTQRHIAQPPLGW